MARVVHFEIHADDPAKCAQFYQRAFGWLVTHLEHIDYWVIATGDGPGIDGGIVRRRGPDPAPEAPVTGFVCSIAVETIEGTIDKVLAAGGTVAVQKYAIPKVGWLAYVKDTCGNLFGLQQADENAG
jgi:predicted enzyme related to lactoylglutathione lyase